MHVYIHYTYTHIAFYDTFVDVNVYIYLDLLYLYVHVICNCESWKDISNAELQQTFHYAEFKKKFSIVHTNC